jgi:hypothetical protein
MAEDNGSKEEIVQRYGEARRINMGVITTTISTFVLVLGLVWNQATWQAKTTDAVDRNNKTQMMILNKLDESSNLIKLNTIRLSEVENTLGKAVTREELFHWLLELKEQNPSIKVPLPPVLTR